MEETNLRARYEHLLLTRDQLKKEAGSFQTAYICRFGDLITQLYSIKIECIRLKKAITYVQAERNRGRTADPEKLNAWLDTEMAGYYRQLNAMLADTEACKKAGTSDGHTVFRVKKLYRALAKQIHPDINPAAAERPEIRDLWQRIMEAYHKNDLSALEELNILVQLELERAGLDCDSPEIPNLEEKIAGLEAEIEQIRTTEPYLYGLLLSDEEAMREKEAEWNEELESYRQYRSQLQDLLGSAGGPTGRYHVVS